QVPQQSRVVASLKVTEAQLALAQPQSVLDVPAAKADTQQQPQPSRGGRSREKVLLLLGLGVARSYQPVRLGARFAADRQPDAGRLGLPNLFPHGLPRQPER